MRVPATKLAIVRESQDIKQKDLAMLLGIRPSTLANVENGWVAPWPKLRKDAARVLGCTQDDLFGPDDLPRMRRP